MIKGIFAAIKPIVNTPGVFSRQIHISQSHKITLSNGNNSETIGCIVKVKPDIKDYERNNISLYYDRSRKELLEHFKKTISKKHFDKESKFFIGYVMQTVFIKEPLNGSYLPHGGHALAGIADIQLDFLHNTVVSKIPTGYPPQKIAHQKPEDIRISDDIILKGQNFSTLAKYEHKNEIKRWIYAHEEGEIAEAKGSGIFIAILPLKLTNIVIAEVEKRLQKEKEEIPDYHRLLLACGQSALSVYANDKGFHYALDTQEAMQKLLTQIAKNKAIQQAITEAILNSQLNVHPKLLQPNNSHDNNIDERIIFKPR